MNVFADKCFKNPIDIIKAFDNKSFIEAFDKIERYRSNYYLLGYIRYEAKDIFLKKNVKSELPFLYFEVYDSYETFSPNSSKYVYLMPQATISFDDYEKDIESIKNWISTGDTYEVNYTFEWNIVYPFDGFELYKSLLKKQRTPYNAYIKNSYDEILSFSPELFFEIENGKIFTKPMKGTISRGKTKEEDLANIEFLKTDIKNRAENVMIVDLLRNDLSKIAKTGTVSVPKLFDVETHPTLHQMTSEVTAEIQDGTTLYEIFEAIFPCGSITGAPKIRTMEIIDELEHSKRNVYCGAIGLITPEKIVFSVPIRILEKNIGSDAYKYHSGGAIVWDSNASDEWNEAHLKASFLTGADLRLVETIKVEDGEPVLFNEHIKRMQNSAKKLGFNFDEKIFDIKPKKDGILRILLSKDGTYEIEEKILGNLPFDKIKISDTVINSKCAFLYHKTNYRPYYNNIDEVFFNEKGELTENSIANIVIEKQGKMYTPPVECGILKGILRDKLLKENKLIEKKLYKSDLINADNIYLINSVRGMWRVSLCL